MPLRQEGRAFTRPWSLTTFLKRFVFFIWDEFKTGMKFLQILVSYGLVLSVRKSISVTIRFCLLNLMGINQFLSYFGSKYIFENMWENSLLGGAMQAPPLILVNENCFFSSQSY